MGHKAAETTCNINTFHPGTANKRTVQWWFKNFCKRLDLWGWECSGQPPEVDNDLLRVIIEVGPPETARQIAEELIVNHPIVIQHLKQIGKVKKLDKWVPCERTKNQKNHHPEVLSSLILQNNYFSIGLWHAMKSGFYVTTGDNQFSGGTEKKLQNTSPNQTYTVKGS